MSPDCGGVSFAFEATKSLCREKWYDRISTRFQEHSGVTSGSAPTDWMVRQASATQDKQRL